MEGYSAAILKALSMRFSESHIRAAMHIGLKRWVALAAGRFELSERELDCAEAMSGRSAGQLAYQGSEMNDSGLAKVLNAWAKVGRPERQSKRSKRVKSLVLEK